MNKIVYSADAVGAKENASYIAPASTDSDGDIFGTSEPVNYMTFENEGIDLTDISTVFLDNTDVSGFISSAVSDGSGTLSGVSMTVRFGSIGNPVYCLVDSLTITFWQNYCKKLRIQLYDKTRKLTDEVFENINTLEFQTDLSVTEECTEVRIQFLETEMPHQFVKIAHLQFGKDITLDEIYSLSLMEEISLTGEDIPYNDLSVTLESEESLFLQQGQRFKAYNRDTMIGAFNIDKADQDGASKYTVSLTDDLAVLDNTYFKGGLYYLEPESDEPFWPNKPHAIVKAIGTAAGVDIMLNSAYRSGLQLVGWLPYDTCRMALMQVAFALGAVVNVGRDGKIYVDPLKPRPTGSSGYKQIGGDRIIGAAKYERGDVVTGVELIEYLYRSQTEKIEMVYEADSAIGIGGQWVTVYHDKPMYHLKINDTMLGDNYSMGPNYLTIKAANKGDEFYRYPCNETKLIHAKNAARTQGKENVKRFDKYTLTCPTFDKLSQLYDLTVGSTGTVTATVVLDGEQVGDWVEIDTKYSGIKRGIIESLDSKVNNDLVAKAVIRCL